MIPAGEVWTVSWYWVSKIAVITPLFWVIEWVMAPPSSHLVHTYCVPCDAACGVGVVIVWVPPVLNSMGAMYSF